MFTGIIETNGIVKNIVEEQGNKRFSIESEITNQLKIDQSVAHNGVCLTVVSVKNNTHEVVAINETLSKTNLNDLKIGDKVNLERCMLMNGRLDGHIVQGHVDGLATCIAGEDKKGSWLFTFKVAENLNHRLIVEKGSICVNGVSLTAFNLVDNCFSVAIIPYTFQHTTFSNLKTNDKVNIEFDIIGKYVERLNMK
jgi:riboflavin synthase